MRFPPASPPHGGNGAPVARQQVKIRPGVAEPAFRLLTGENPSTSAKFACTQVFAQGNPYESVGYGTQRSERTAGSGLKAPFKDASPSPSPIQARLGRCGQRTRPNRPQCRFRHRRLEEANRPRITYSRDVTVAKTGIFRFSLVGVEGLIALTVVVDLRAPTIPKDQRVWRLFPGSSYQFLGDFDKQGVGFLDLPGLELPSGSLAEAKDMIARVARSLRIRNLLWDQGPQAKIELNLKDFARSRSSQNRTRIANAIVSFYEIAKKGDFVVLPEPKFLSRIWVGRFTGDKPTVGFFQRRYGRTKIPARGIQWMGNFAENTVSTALSLSLRHQHPFTLLEKDLHVEVFSLAYGSFVYGERHAATVYNDKSDFLDSDAALLGAVSRLAAAALQSIDTKGDLAGENLLDILLRSPPIEYTCTQEADIHSPGFNRYIAGSAVALVIASVSAALIGLSEHSSAGNVAADAQQMVITNTAPDADPACTARVSEASARILKALGTDRTWALCQAAKAARDRAGLRSSATPHKQ
jgi:hypothetical protein